MDGVYAALTRVPLFSGVRPESIEVVPLGGGLTNACYKVTIGDAAYMLRLAGRGTSEYIDRSAEEHNARIAAETGVGAEVVYFHVGDGTMVTRWVEGASLDTGEDLAPGVPMRIARTLRRVHGLVRVFKSRFDVFAAIDGYLHIMRKERMTMPMGYGEANRGANAVRRALAKSPVAPVPCHNDPWPGNLLDSDGRIYLIDWEYSGMNDPMWDLANLSVEAGFGPDEDQEVMEAYYGSGEPPALYSRLEVYKAMGDLHWSLWGFVQHAKGNTTENFWDYGLARLGHSNERMDGADFGRHVELVRRSDPRTFPVVPTNLARRGRSRSQASGRRH